MRKILVALIAIASFGYLTVNAQTKKELQAYDVFLTGSNTSAKDYILSLFKTHDIVVLCERMHTEFTQYNLLTGIIADKRFINEVGNVFTEVGLSTLNPALNNFIHTKNLSEDSISKSLIYFQRNCNFWPTWNNANYAYFIRSLYDINVSLPAQKAINIYPSDLPFTWQGVDSASMAVLRGQLENRDSIIAQQVIDQFNNLQLHARHKKALVIMNYRHAFNEEFIIGGRHLKNTAWYLFQKYNSRVANVLLNTVVIGNNGFSLVQKGKWDAAFANVNNKSTGFNFAGSPFGKDSFDIWPYKTSLLYQDVFTGFAFYEPVQNHHMVEGVPGFVDPAYKQELLKRMDMITLVNREFKSKLEQLKILIENNNFFLNERNDRQYYKLDSLLMVRDAWLK